MGVIAGGYGPVCRSCAVLSWAPRECSYPWARHTCTCGVIWEADESAIQDFESMRARGEDIPTNRWGDQHAGGLYEVVIGAATVAPAAVLAYDRLLPRWKGWRRGHGSGRRLEREDAVHHATQRLLLREGLSADQIGATEVRWTEGGGRSAEVDLCSDAFEWTVKVELVKSQVKTTVQREPAWVPSRTPETHRL